MKKLFGFLLLIASASAEAQYAVAVCYDKDYHHTMEYVCMTNPWWGGPLWVKKTVDAGPGSWPAASCVKENGYVFNSTKTVIQECIDVDNGTTLEYHLLG